MKNYCALPFGHMCTDTMGDYRVCCQHPVPKDYRVNIRDVTPEDWLKNAYLQEVRDSIANDVRHPGCSTCWKTEDAGMSSMRNITAKEYKILGVHKCQEKFVNVEVQAGNLCNLTCIMCDETSSSAIHAENKKLGISVINQNSVKWNDQAWNNFEKILKMQPKVLTIRGGEPLYNKKLLEIIENLSEEQCANTLLHIITNATAWNERWQIALARFKLVRMMLSIDGVGDVYEYIRYPAKWDAVNANIDSISAQPNFKIVVHTTVQNLNIGNLEHIIDWCNQKRFFIQLYKCYNPEYLQPVNLPEKLIDPTIEQLKRCLKKTNYTNVQQFVDSCIKELNTRRSQGLNLDLWTEFVSMMTMRESLRGNNHKTILDYT